MGYAIYVGSERCPVMPAWFDNAVSEARYRARMAGAQSAQVVHEPTGNIAEVRPMPVPWSESYDRDLSVLDPTPVDYR